jgi:hypothetical protein
MNREGHEAVNSVGHKKAQMAQKVSEILFNYERRERPERDLWSMY